MGRSKSEKRKYYENILAEFIKNDRVLNPKKASKDLPATLPNLEKVALYLGYPIYGEVEEETVEIGELISDEKKQDKLESKIINWRSSGLDDDVLEFSLNDYTLENLINTITDLLSGEKIHIKFGDNYYTLNQDNIARILKLIRKQLVNDDEVTGSDREFLTQLQLINVITFIKKSGPYTRRNGGAFFEYLHKTHLNLSDFGIYKTINKDNYKMNCLTKALTVGGLSDVKINRLMTLVCNRNIPICKLNEICDEIQICISLNRVGREYKTVYGDEKNQNFDICLVEDHYFINKTVPITSFALENYNELFTKFGEDCCNIYKITKGYYNRDGSIDRFIKSYQLVSILLEHKDELLEKINFNSEMLSTPFYGRLDDITNLNYMDSEVRVVSDEDSDDEEEKIQYEQVFFDFETITTDYHVPYLCCYDLKGNVLTFKGEDCGLKMLQTLKTNTMLIAHNAGYDYKMLLKYLWNIKIISKGNGLITCSAKFGELSIKIKDTYKLIPMALKEFGQCFTLEQSKEIMPYKLYSKENIAKRFIDLSVIREGKYLTDEDMETFILNCKKWKILKDDKVDIVEYSTIYCKIDCNVLKNGYYTFRKWMQEITSIDTDDVLTLTSLAHKYLTNEGVYNGCYELSGVPRAFIQNCVVGGRVMVRDNIKQMYGVDEKIKICDFDAVALYPSAMNRMGFLKGKPKVLENLTYDFLKEQDGYFVYIKILEVGKPQHFPLLSVLEDNVRNFTNNIVGRCIYTHMFELEDMITYQEIKFEILKGYYFNDGRNYKINDVIKYIFYERVKMKNVGNPIQMVYKLLMNSAYGMTLLNPVETKQVIFNDKKALDKYVNYNFNYIIEYSEIYGTGKYIVKAVKPINKHFNLVHIGVEVLGMSKRIMNEVMCLAEDEDIDLYYQDTDSIHLKENQINKLADVFEKTYERKLIGKDMGQFHSDFSIEGCKEVYAEKSIFLGKKKYIDSLVGIDKQTGKEKRELHIRMAGIPTSCVRYEATNKYGGDVFKLYEDLYRGEKVSFDLLEGGCRVNFQHTKDMRIKTNNEFTRTIKV